MNITKEIKDFLFISNTSNNIKYISFNILCMFSFNFSYFERLD